MKKSVGGSRTPPVIKTRKKDTGRGSFDGRTALRGDVLEVTGRREMEEALRQSEALYHRLFDVSPDAIVIHRAGRIILANAAALRLMGAASAADLIGKPILDLIHPDFRGRVTDRTRPHMAAGTPAPALEEKFLRLDGTIIDVEVMAEPIHDQNGPASLVIFRDITKRKEVEEALRENEQRYRILFEGANDAIFLMDAEKFLECNEMTLQMFGCSSREDIVGHSPWEFSPARQPDGRDSMDKAREVIQAALDGRPQRFYWVHTRKDRSPFDAEVSLNRFMIGTNTFLQAIVRDTTERQQAELLQTAVYRITQAADTSASLGDLFRSVHEIIGTVMPAKNFYIALSNGADDPITFPYHVDEFDAPPQPSRSRRGLTEYVLRTGTSLLCDKTVDRELLRRGEVELVGAPAEIWLGVPLRVGNKAIGAMVVQHYTDRTAYGLRELRMLEYVSSQVAKSIARKRAEEALRESETKFRAVFESSVDAIGVSKAGRHVFINPSYLTLFGYDRPEELIGRPILDLIAPDRHETVAGKMLPWTQGEITPGFFETRGLRKDGSQFDMDVHMSAFELQDTTYILCILRDITLQKRAQEQLERSYEQLQKATNGIAQAMALTVELKDPYTAGHQKRVAELAYLLAQEMGLSEDQCECIRVAGTIHDVGKISIPTEILSKPSALSALEYEMIKDHSRIGYEILKGIEFPWPIAQIIYQHHERMDGSGYPLGLLGERVLLEAKVLAVADVVEAMASHRPYRPAKGIKIAIMEISTNQGVLYDPDVVDACLKVFIEKGFKFDRGSYRSPQNKG